jgi:hypothetical protein
MHTAAWRKDLQHVQLLSNINTKMLAYRASYLLRYSFLQEESGSNLDQNKNVPELFMRSTVFTWNFMYNASN